jgi:UPF0755 protein
MKSEYKYITVRDWIAFFVSSLLIFLSSVLLVISAVIFALLRLVKKNPVFAFAFMVGLVALFLLIQWMVISIRWQAESDCVSIIIKHGDSMSRVIQRLNEEKVIEDGKGLLVLAKFLGKDRHIQVGRYDFEKGMTLFSVFTKLIRGDVTLNQVTIPEGWTVRQIAGILQREIQIDSSEFVRIAMDRRFAESMDVSASSLEGYLFPDTYKFSWGTSPEKAAQIMVDQFKRTLADSLLRRAEEMDFSVSEIVTLASLIEAEARVEQERGIISAVFQNRLRRGMLLQCCATVVYAMPEVELPLLFKDLDVDSPYNTYKHPGLPPGPICNPGKACILAALYPAEVDYLYFVSKGDGTHVFSSSLTEHNRAKSRINRAQRNDM